MPPSAHRLVTLACLAATLAACPARIDHPEPEEITLNVYTYGAPQITTLPRRHAAEFTEATGIKVNIMGEPDFDKLFPTMQRQAVTASRSYDLLLVANIWVADLVNLGYVRPLDAYIDADQGDPELAWDDIPPGIRRKNSFGGHVYGLLADNDNTNLFYRKDILGSPRWREAYLAETGKPLPNPPQTIDELLEVAKFFQGKDWDDDGLPEDAFVTNVTPGTQAHWYAYSWTAPYSVPPAGAPAPGMFLFKDDMTPLVNTPGFVRGVQKWIEMINCCTRASHDTDRQAVIDDIIQGKALMAIDWGDIGPASLRPTSVVKDKIGFALSPGSYDYFNWGNDTWVHGRVLNRVPMHQFNGWSWFLTSTSRHPDAAWKFLKFMASPHVSGGDVADPSGGFQPWRTSHTTQLQPWVAAGWTESEAQSYVQTILAATNHENASLDIRIPGAFQYGAALERQLFRAVRGEVSAQEAMDQAAADMDEITNTLGREPQIRAYHSHLGLPWP